MQKVDGVVDYTQKLVSEGHNLKIITSRGTSELEIVKEWIQKIGLNFTFIGVGGGVKKTEACRGLDVYIDDDLDKLEPLVGIVPYRFLFSWGYNQHIQVPQSVAKRIESWQHFYEEMVSLSGKLVRSTE